MHGTARVAPPMTPGVVRLIMKNIIVYILPILSFAMALFPEYTIANDRYEFESGAIITITEKGSEQKGVFCEFHVPEADQPDQIMKFFSNSKMISYSEMQKIYLQPPCFIRGKIIDSHGTHKWEIKCFITGRIKLQNGKELYFVNNAKCE